MKLILELAKLRKNNIDWLTTRFQDSECNEKTIEIYKEKIQNSFYTKTGRPKTDLLKAKRAVSDFKKASKDKESIIDLMIFYAKTGTEYLCNYDGPEQLYTNMENIFDNVIKLLIDSTDSIIIAKSKPRLEEIIKKANDLGYGYPDSIEAMYEKLKVITENQKGGFTL